MNILFAGRVNLNQERGNALHFAQLARALADRGHNLTIIALGDNIYPQFQDLKAQLISPSRIRKIGLLSEDARFLAKARHQLSENVYDLVYQRGVPYLNHVAKRYNLPSVVEVNGIWVSELNLKGVSDPYIQLARYREKMTLASSSKIICVAEGIKNQLIELYKIDSNKCVVISNAADTEIFRPYSKKVCQEKVGLDPKCFNIGFVGTFQEWVDFKTLINAVELLINGGNYTQLTLVGDGPQYSKIKSQLTSEGKDTYIKLTGRIPHDEVPTWIGAFDVCVVAVKPLTDDSFEGSPLKLFEYMASERAVVATDIPGIGEVIRNASSGLTYVLQDEVSLAEKLIKLLDDKDLRSRLSKNGRKYVEANHSWESVARKMESIACNLLCLG